MSYPIYYVEENDTLPILFDTFDGGDGSSITMSGLAVTDIEIYKDGGVTQRSSDSGYSLLDTDGIDFDSITGIHGFSIDLSDNTDAGFFAVGSWYHVVVSSVTVDTQTVNFIAAAFRIVSATRGMAGTALPDAAADAAGGLPISDAGGLDLDTQIGTDIDAILADTNELQTDDVPGLIAALNDPAAATIADAVWDEAATGHTDAGKAGAQLWTDVDAILADTNELQGDWTNGGRLDLILDELTTQGDTNESAISGLNDITASDVTTDMDANSTQLAAIVADTNELQTDDVPGLIAALNDPTAAAIADAVWDEAATGHTDAGKAGEQLWTDIDAVLADTNELQTDDIPGTIAALNDISASDVTTDMDANSTQLAAIVADTNELQTDDVPGLIAALNDLSAADVNAEVDTAFTTQMVDSVATDGTIATREQALYMILQFLSEFSISGTTLTVKKVDGSTSLMTFTLDDDTSPTSITRAS